MYLNISRTGSTDQPRQQRVSDQRQQAGLLLRASQHPQENIPEHLHQRRGQARGGPGEPGQSSHWSQGDRFY